MGLRSAQPVPKWANEQTKLFACMRTNTFLLGRAESFRQILLSLWCPIQGRVRCCRYHGLVCPAVCIALMGRTTCTLSLVPAISDCLC